MPKRTYTIPILTDEGVECDKLDVNLATEEYEEVGGRVVTSLRESEMDVFGCEDCSRENCIIYLAAINDMSESMAEKVVDKHLELVERGEMLKSNTSYVVREIIEASGMSKDVD